MGGITIINNTNVAINSCISAGVNYSWVNELKPKTFYFHEGCAGVYTLNTCYALGDASQFGVSAAEIGLWVSSTIIGVAGLLAIPFTFGTSAAAAAQAIAALGAVQAGVAIAGFAGTVSGLAIGGIALAVKDFDNAPSKWTNIHALHNRRFIAEGDISIKPSATNKGVYDFVGIPQIRLREITDETEYYDMLMSGKFTGHGKDAVDQWSAPKLHGGALASAPAVGKNKRGGLEVFALNPERGISHTWEIEDGSGWSDWTLLGWHSAKFQGAPAVALNRDGRLEVFGRDANNALVHIVQKDDGHWGEWRIIAGETITSNPVPHRRQNGSLCVWALDRNGQVCYANKRNTDNDWVWTRANWLRGDFNGKTYPFKGRPAVSMNKDAIMEAFAWGYDNAVGAFALAYTGVSFADDPRGFNDAVGNPAVAQSQFGGSQVFVVRADGCLWSTCRSGKNPGGLDIPMARQGFWFEWRSLGQPTSDEGPTLLLGDPVACTNELGQLEVFVRDSVGTIYHIRQQSTGQWTAWRSIGSATDCDLAVGCGRSGGLDVFVRARDNTLHQLTRTPG